MTIFRKLLLVTTVMLAVTSGVAEAQTVLQAGAADGGLVYVVNTNQAGDDFFEFTFQDSSTCSGWVAAGYVAYCAVPYGSNYAVLTQNYYGGMVAYMYFTSNVFFASPVQWGTMFSATKWTGVAVANVSGMQNYVTFSVYSGMQLVAQLSGGMPAGADLAIYVHDLFPPSEYPQLDWDNHTYTFHVASSYPTSSMGAQCVPGVWTCSQL